VSNPYVLIVDDEKNVADSLALVLNRYGYQARAVYSGTEALTLLKSFIPDVLVLDVFMPDVNGFTLAEMIRDLKVRSRVIFMSGNAGTSELLKHLPPEGLEILAKPFPPSELLNLLQTRPVQKHSKTV
jgi:DNA-binding response OmpR family regulator